MNFPKVRSLVLPLLSAALLTACDRPTASEPIIESFTGPVPLVNFDAAGNALVRFDVDGNQVDAHGGEIRQFGDRYYWYAETYGCGFEWQKHSPSPFCGFRVYTSPNLTDWTDGGLLFDVSQWDPWQQRCNWWTYGCFRPHVVYNAATRNYVLWVNMYDVPVGYHVLVSSTPTGPFVEQPIPRLAYDDGAPGQVNNGDEDLFVDDDGTGYIVYAEWRVNGGDIVVERLTPDYLSGTGEYVRVGTHHSEAPSLFKRGGEYYLIASTPPNWAYGKATTSYFRASTPLGSWSKGRSISSESCGGQAAHVAQLPTASGGSWYLYQVDLWLNSDSTGGGDANQAPAPQFWTPLSFDSRGAIQPIRCRPSYGMDAWTAAPPNPEPPTARLQCDIGATTGVEIAREFRIAADTAGVLGSVEFPVYQRGEPNTPLVAEVRGDSGALLHREEILPRRWAGDPSPPISWAARKLRIPVDVPVTAGQRLSLRLHSATRQGCYGFAFQDDVADPLVESRLSRDAGGRWTLEGGREPRMDLIMN
jgi:hypothetical protein